jgi:hypothetical protein
LVADQVIGLDYCPGGQFLLGLQVGIDGCVLEQQVAGIQGKVGGAGIARDLCELKPFFGQTAQLMTVSAAGRGLALHVVGV